MPLPQVDAVGMGGPQVLGHSDGVPAGVEGPPDGLGQGTEYGRGLDREAPYAGKLVRRRQSNCEAMQRQSGVMQDHPAFGGALTQNSAGQQQRLASPAQGRQAVGDQSHAGRMAILHQQRAAFGDGHMPNFGP